MRLTDLGDGGRARAPPRRPAGRRQHVRQPVPSAADRVRRRPRHPQHDEVSERPQRQRRRRGHRGQRRGHRVAADSCRTPPAPSSARSIRGWCCAAPRRCRSAWRSTARPASRSREFLEAHPKVRKRVLSRVCRRIRSTRWPHARCEASAACSRSTWDRSKPPRASAEQRPPDGARREPRRRRNAHLASRHDDARLGAGGAAHRARHHRRTGANFGRPRGPRGPEGGPVAGARTPSRRAPQSLARARRACGARTRPPPAAATRRRCRSSRARSSPSRSARCRTADPAPRQRPTQATAPTTL